MLIMKMLQKEKEIRRQHEENKKCSQMIVDNRWRINEVERYRHFILKWQQVQKEKFSKHENKIA